MIKRQVLQILFGILGTLFPGILGVFLAQKDKIEIAYRVKDSLYLIFSPVIGVAAALTVFLTKATFDSTLHFRLLSQSDPLFNFVFYLAIFTAIFFVGSLGNEVLFRGYLWEKWKDNRAMQWIGIWGTWSILSLVLSACAGNATFWTPIYYALLMPVLHVFRLKSGSIIPGNLCYASYSAGYVYFSTASVM